MSYAFDSATKIHDRQVAAAGTVQSLLVTALDGLSGLAGKTPQAPEKLSSTLQSLAAPVTRIVGTPSEVRAHAVASCREWVEVQHQFQTALLDAVSPPIVTVEVPRRTAPRNR